MLTNLKIHNFKVFQDVSIELGSPVVFIGPNNSGKTTALQALALWGMAHQLQREINERKLPSRIDFAINRQNFFAAPIPDTILLWRNRHPDSFEIGVEGVSPAGV